MILIAPIRFRDLPYLLWCAWLEERRTRRLLKAAQKPTTEIVVKKELVV